MKEDSQTFFVKEEQDQMQLQGQIHIQQQNIHLKQQIETKKRHLLKEYLLHPNQQYNSHFVDDLFLIAQKDQQIAKLLENNIEKAINSKSFCDIYLLDKICQYPHLKKFAIKFFEQFLKVGQTNLNQRLEMDLICRSWEFILKLFTKEEQKLVQLINCLCYKLRSLNQKIRYQALLCFQKVAKMVTNEPCYDHLKKILEFKLPQMIQKQILVKEANYGRGIFLQILEDQYHKIRILCLQLLFQLQNYFSRSDIKIIFVFMLNDEHELVRETALIKVKDIQEATFNQEQTDTIMMCLKQKRKHLRVMTYQILATVSLENSSIAYKLISKLISTVSLYKNDKKQIFKTLNIIGNKFKNQMKDFFLNIYSSIPSDQEPNIKSLSYKAKLVTIFSIWQRLSKEQLQSLSLPLYFNRHILYVRDTQNYLFKQIIQNTNTEDQMSDYDDIFQDKNNLISFIESQIEISSQFYSEIFKMCLQLIQEKIQINHPFKCQRLLIKYNLNQNQQQILQLFQKKENDITYIIRKCLEDRQKCGIVPIHPNKCFTAKQQPNLIYASKSEVFVDSIYLKCFFNNLLVFKNLESKRFTYKKLSKLQKSSQDEAYYGFHLKLNLYSAIQIMVTYARSQPTLLNRIELQKK